MIFSSSLQVRSTVFSFVMAWLATLSLHAQLTYLDAIDGSNGNTTLSNGSVLDATDTTGATTWRQRDNIDFGSQATIFEGIEPSPEIRTRISGLTPGASYRVYVHFWDTGSLTEDWNVRAGFNSGNLSTFAREAGAVAGAIACPLSSTLTYSTAPSLFGPVSNRDNLAALLGVALANGVGQIDVFIDDFGSTSVNTRTWYDGVSYELVAPPAPTDEIFYVDATASNTLRWDTLPFAPAAQGNTVIDNNWETRTLGNAATVFESNADGPEDAPMLVTTITGLLPLTDYVLYAYFWHDGRNWQLKASANSSIIQNNGTPSNLTDDFLPSTAFAYFSSLNSVSGVNTLAPVPLAGSFATAPMLTEGNRTLRQASLGKFTSDAAGQLNIYIDDVAAAGEGNRTWFDGVGYKRALPLVDLADEDGDGLNNQAETAAGTNAYLVDSDGDGYNDAVEVNAGSNPLLASSVPPLLGNGLAIAPDGAWTWFNDDRAIFHQGVLFVGYVMKDGRYGITRYDPAANVVAHTVISTANSQQQDDHNNPSITVLPDGRLLALYAKHLGGAQFYQRTSLVTSPATLADWGPEITVATPNNNTYNNTYILSEENNTIYNFHRCINFNPTITKSLNAGQTWQPSVQLIEVGTNNVRPYPRYCSNRRNRIDLIYTDGHPRDVDNSIYHMYYQDGGFYKTDGTLIDTIENLPLDHQGGQRGSVIYTFSNAAWEASNDADDWIPAARGWTWDIHYGTDGHPVCVFQVQLGTDATWATSRIYYYYARWNGSAWVKKFIAQGGRGIYAAESDYGGGMSIDPSQPNVVYISSNAANPFSLESINPVTLNPNTRFELYRGVTNDGGQSFSWQVLTSNSSGDNLRPIVPENHGYDRALLWFHGTYSSYANYDTRVLGIFQNDLRLSAWNLGPLSGQLTWKSSPGKSYRITGSSNLQSFPHMVAEGILSQGSQTTHSFSYPIPQQNAPKNFFRVEEE